MRPFADRVGPVLSSERAPAALRFRETYKPYKRRGAAKIRELLI